jgi:hypothetical protein
MFENLTEKIRGVIKHQAGNVLVYLAIGLVPIIACTGLVIDYGTGVWCKTDMQKAVDAAALAGASELPGSNAVALAEELAEINYPHFDNYDVEIQNDMVVVTMDRAVPTRFMRVLGWSEINVNVLAKAIKPTPVSTMRGNIMPFCIINPNTNDDPDDDLTDDNYGRPYILQYGEDNTIVQDWANGTDPTPQNNTGGGLGARGWRGALDLDADGTLDGAGAHDFRENIINSWPGTAEIDDRLPIETGNMAGPADQGREERLQGEEDYIFDNFDPDQDFDMSRVVYVPVVSLIVEGTDDIYTIDDFFNEVDWHHQEVVIDGFAPFYMLTNDEQGDVDGDGKAKDSDWITGFFIPGVRAPLHSGGGGSSDMGTEVTARLIQ